MLATIMEYLTLDNLQVAGVTVGSAVVLFGFWKVARVVFGIGRGAFSLASKTKGAWSHLYVPGALIGVGMSVDYALANPEYFWTAIGGGVSGLTMAWDGLRARGWFGGHGMSKRRYSAERTRMASEVEQKNHEVNLRQYEEAPGGRH